MGRSLKAEMKTVQPGLTLVFKQTGKMKHFMSVSIAGATLCMLRATQELKAQSTGPEILCTAVS